MLNFEIRNRALLDVCMNYFDSIIMVKFMPTEASIQEEKVSNRANLL